MKSRRVPAGVRPRQAGFRASSLRLTSAGITALVIAGAATISGQQQVLVPGQNINMVSGTTFPGGDPFLQKQNESSLAVSTRNPCHLLGGANDYRAVNLPGDFADGEIGDSWVGLYKSTDCGQTWFSTLVPGYPQDTSAAGTASPVHGLSTGADPVIRSGPAGFFAYSFIAFNRSTGAGKLAVARFIDNNDKEAGDPIQYLDTRIVDSGSVGRFLDKPALAVSRGTGTCTVAGRTIPASVVHSAWTVFVGNDTTNRTKVYYAKSSNCGATLDRPATKLSEGFPINQGAIIAVNPVDGSVYVAWRQFASDRTTDAILFVKSTDGGNTFTKAAEVPLGIFQPFDQSTTNVSFRTNAYPTMVFDHLGRLYLAVAARGYVNATNQTRIVVTSTTDGVNWLPPSPVEPDLTTSGHQIMPALTYAGGQLNLIWYDFRDDAAGEAAKLETFIQERYPIRHTVDVRGAQAPVAPNGSLAWSTYGVLQLDTDTADRISQYLIGGEGTGVSQLQHNPPNLRLYAGGTKPFFGDYIDVAGLPFVATRVGGATQWVVNDGSIPTSGASTFHATWTDNRDARMVSQSMNLPEEGDEPVTGYQAPGAACTAPDLTETRNANVYTSRITPGIAVLAPGNAKPVLSDGTSVQRAFAVLVQNNTNAEKTFRLTIVNPDPLVSASFAQFPPGLSMVDVVIPRRSSATRTVYVSSSSNRLPAVQVQVQEIDAVGNPVTGGLTGSTLLNPDIQNPDIQNPDIQNPDIQNPDIQNTEVHNPDIQNPDIQNPDIQNPDIQNPDIQNPDIQNPDIQNPDIQNPDIQNPDIQNPDIQNPDIQNPDIQNGSVTDVSWDVTNEGNTTSGFQVKVNATGDLAQYVFQLIGRRVYKTPTANGCELTEQGQNQILFNIENPVLTGDLPDPNAEDRTNATLLLTPGETVKITLRAWDKDVLAGQGNGVTTPFCPFVDTDGALCSQVNASATAIIAAQAANTGETTPEVAAFPRPDLIVSSLTHTPATGLAGAPMTFTAIVQNIGAGAAFRARLLFTIGGETPGAPGTLIQLPTLAPGASFAVQRTATLIAQGYQNNATVDPDEILTESNESNNTTSDTFTVIDSFVVTTTADSGAGSLRDAITNANGTPGLNGIVFDIPATAGNVIGVQSALPPISDPVTIDAATAVADCSSSAPPVQVNWIGGTGPADGLVVNAASTTIRGLSITGFGGAGIVLNGASNDVVACNYIGLAPDGGTPVGNGTGIRIAGGTGHTIGGATSAARNFVSGNNGDGLFIGPGSSGNLINGNYIGVDATLTTTVSNNGEGIQIVDSPNNTIGSTNVAANVISGNDGEGVRIDGALASGNTVRGNFIGISPSGQADFGNNASGVYIRNAPSNTVVGNTISGNDTFAGVAICGVGSACGGGDPAGVTLGNPANANVVKGNRIGTNGGAIGPTVIGNSGRGVSLDGVTNNVVGGPLAADGNVIVGSGAVGAVVLFDNATGNIVRGNYIGTDETGNANLGNDTPGVVILDGSDNVIGGLDANRTAPNIIRNNVGDGIQVIAGTNNKLRINRIDSNTGLEINLGTDGITDNDPGDVDTGPNDLQNAPVLTAATLAGGTLTVSGSLNSTPGTTFTIDFYASATCDGFTGGSGSQWLGAFTATTDGAGDASWTNTGFSGLPVPDNQVVTALATRGDHITTPDATPASTSEFSNCVPAPIVILLPENQ